MNSRVHSVSFRRSSQIFQRPFMEQGLLILEPSLSPESRFLNRVIKALQLNKCNTMFAQHRSPLTKLTVNMNCQEIMKYVQ